MGGGGSRLLLWFLPIPLNPKILLLWFIQRADVCLFPCIFHHTEGQLPHLRSPIAVWNYLAG